MKNSAKTACLLITCLLVLLPLLPAGAADSAYVAAAKQGRQSVSSGQQQQKVYSGNIKSGKYHNSRCRYFNCPNCKAVFSSPQEAIGKGFVACKVCGG